MRVHDPTAGYREEGFRHAVTKLQEIVRKAHAKRTPESGPLGDQILEAVNALPHDRTKFDALPPETKRPFQMFITQTETNYAADRVIELLDPGRG